MYYTHPGCRTSILGENRAYCIRDFTVHVTKSKIVLGLNCLNIMAGRLRLGVEEHSTVLAVCDCLRSIDISEEVVKIFESMILF